MNRNRLNCNDSYHKRIMCRGFFIKSFWFLDERSKGWLLVDSPGPTLLYTMLYLLIVWAGPKVMRKRKAFKLTWALVPYNLAMACLNAYIAIQVNTISCPPMMGKYRGAYLHFSYLSLCSHFHSKVGFSIAYLASLCILCSYS